MHGTVRRPALQSPEPPDTFFAVVAGLYVALLVAPGIVFAVAHPLGAAGLYVGLLAALTAITVAGTVAVGRLHGVAERLGASPFAPGLGVGALLCAVGYGVAAVVIEPPSGGVALSAGVVLSGFGIVAGLLLAAMARTRYARAVVDDAVRVEWRAGWPQPLRRRVQIATLIVYLGGSALYFGGELVGLGRFRVVGSVAFVGGAAVLGYGQPRGYRLAPAGIERSNYVHRRLYEWDAFESFAVTEDAIVLRRSGLWPAFRCWRAEIDDEDELIDALDDHLPRACGEWERF